MRKTMLAGLMLAALSTSTAFAGPVVNGTAISQARIDAVVKMMEAQAQGQNQQASGPQLQNMVKDQLITFEVLRQEGVKQGMDKSADYRAELENMQAMALANRVIREFQRTHPLTDAELKTEYDKLVATIPENKSYHAQHILVASEAEAKAALEALKKGKPFVQLAKEKSTDPGSKDNGGDLGWQDARTFVPSFRTALTKLSKGQITAQPVQTQFGWHIIKLDDVRSERNVPQLDQIRPQLTQRIMGERVDQYINSLKSQAKIQQ